MCRLFVFQFIAMNIYSRVLKKGKIKKETIFSPREKDENKNKKEVSLSEFIKDFLKII